MLDKWRARIGWIHPRVNSDIEIYDFYQAAPKDVVLVITHLEVVDSARKEEVEASLQQLERAVERLRPASKVPVTTSSQALADAFHALGAKTILVISSWRKESVHMSDNLRNFLNSEGIEIAALEGIGGRQLSSYEKLGVTPAQIFHNALEASRKHAEVDAVYIQSGTMATMGIIDELEQQIGKPVVSSNSVNIWGSLKPLNIKVGTGFGRLLASI